MERSVGGYHPVDRRFPVRKQDDLGLCAGNGVSCVGIDKNEPVIAGIEEFEQPEQAGNDQ